MYIGLGSNLGDREEQLLRAVKALGCIDAVAVLRRSSLYDSAPVGGPPQPRYLNAVVELACGLVPQQLLSIAKQIELDLGRFPSVGWGPRAVDLDVLLWGGQVVADANLQVPHLGLHQRQFVLDPLCELCPELVHPVLGVSMQTLLQRLRPQDVLPFDSVRWPFAQQPFLETAK